MISGATRVVGVIGHPVHHSLSPALHNAAFAELGLDWVYAAFDVASGHSAQALDAMRTLNLAGLSVTMPHKEGVAKAVDVLDPAAAALRSVNTVVRDSDGKLKGYSTDGAGLVSALSAMGVTVTGKPVCVIGAGAAGRSIVDALARSGAAQITVVNRTFSTAHEAAELAGAVGRVGYASDIRDAEIVVNATSIGMGSDDLPCDPALLHAGQVVADIVYHPLVTAFLRAAIDAGALAAEGLGMLVHQAALQQQLWHRQVPDVGVMAAAAKRELAQRHQ